MITFFDLETTGTSTTKDRIVSLSAIQTTNDFKRIFGSEKSLVFNPTIYIPKEASDVHGITNEMVFDKPTFKQYAPKILKYFNESDILSGYNIRKFDIPMIFEEFSRYGYQFELEKFKIIDSCQIFYKKEPRDLTAAVKFYCGKSLEGAHNSDNDTIASIDVLEGQMFIYDLSIEDAIEMSEPKDKNIVDFDGKIKRREEDGVFIWGNFGKNANKPVLDDLKYCDWIISADFSSHTKHILMQILTHKLI